MDSYLCHPDYFATILDLIPFIAKVFKWLTLVLFAYVITAFLAQPDWPAVLHSTFVPTSVVKRLHRHLRRHPWHDHLAVSLFLGASGKWRRNASLGVRPLKSAKVRPMRVAQVAD